MLTWRKSELALLKGVKVKLIPSKGGSLLVTRFRLFFNKYEFLINY
jgi:hypothetical protein